MCTKAILNKISFWTSGKLTGEEIESLLKVPASAPKPGDYPVYSAEYQQLKDDLQAQGVETIRKDKFQPDHTYFWTDRETMAILVPFLTLPGSYYVDDIFNCKNYAEFARLKCALNFHIDSVLSGWGSMPLGYHAFGLTYHGKDPYGIFEPNKGFTYAGKLYLPADIDYHPDGWE
jgi:hypothetical protein